MHREQLARGSAWHWTVSCRQNEGLGMRLGTVLTRLYTLLYEFVP